MTCTKLLTAISRKKLIDNKRLLETDLKRQLNIPDVLGIGFGGSVGLAVYVLITYVARSVAGPAVVLSVLIAGTSAILSGFCFSEFSLRLPRAGSAYLYTYATIGELCGFMVGWSMILEHAIGVAIGAKAWSQYFGHITNNSIPRWMNTSLQWSDGINTDQSPDLIAVAVLIVCTITMLISTKLSTIINCILCILGGVVVFSIICVGFFHVKHDNWTGGDGFFQFGIQGILSGASILVFPFITVDTVANTAEEQRNPLRNFPVSFAIVIILTIISMTSVSAAVTLMTPANTFSETAGIAVIFESHHIQGARYVFSVGALLYLLAGTISLLLAIPRIMYSLSRDGLFPDCLGNLTSKGKIPVKALLLTICLSMVLVLCCKLTLLLSLLGTGTLLTFSVVSLCVLCLRYQQDCVGMIQEYEDPNEDDCITEFSYPSYINKQFCSDQDDVISFKNSTRMERPRGSTYKKMNSIVSMTSVGSESVLFPLHLNDVREPSATSWLISLLCIVIYLLSSVVVSLMVTFGLKYICNGSWWSIFLLLVILGTMAVSAFVLCKQPQNHSKLLYRTPGVPILPLFSLTLNIFLLTSLQSNALLRFSIWLLIGTIFYFCYGVRKSKERISDEQEVILYAVRERD
ncbi:probable cationic amino acid transporter isoform X2 [Ostrea edulis]|uniref:probable cationic amino acid transporter isoform X2 n=1 Tax=Ostrea edulis TaxID=37623 RepID=UPI0024AF0D81|nr:probable cationic amino acid transporter isoform X2 [Ostrea edulis]XP_048738902.2 probable cationic amino acid transporter isoform X2 [Ostrea edulis]XP_048738911.2 probable cationic amino acid transporter isoform X2 [Ostrea edulis]